MFVGFSCFSDQIEDMFVRFRIELTPVLEIID